MTGLVDWLWCVFIVLNICTYVYIYIYIIYVYIYIYIYIYMCVCMYACIHTCIHTYMHTYTCILAYILAYKLAYIHACMHACMYVFHSNRMCHACQERVFKKSSSCFNILFQPDVRCMPRSCVGCGVLCTRFISTYWIQYGNVGFYARLSSSRFTQNHSCIESHLIYIDFNEFHQIPTSWIAPQ